MPAHVVQIKGSNGAGKTTIVKQLLAKSQRSELKTWSVTGTKVYGTVMHDLKWAAVGPYYLDAAMGGCDTFQSIKQIKQAIFDLRDNYPGYWLVFEGMMISTIKSTFYDFLLELAQTDPIVPDFVILNATIDGCMRRIKARGTMKADLDVENVAGKCASIIRHAKEYDQKYVKWMDVENIHQVQSMLLQFLWKIGDNELLDAMSNTGYGEVIDVVRR